jgi:hypothetical protein
MSLLSLAASGGLACRGRRGKAEQIGRHANSGRAGAALARACGRNSQTEMNIADLRAAAIVCFQNCALRFGGKAANYFARCAAQ